MLIANCLEGSWYTPPGTFHPGIFPPEMECSPPTLFRSGLIANCLVLGILPHGKFPTPPRFSVATLFQLVARFTRVRIEYSSRNRFASTAYFAQSQTTLFPCILFMGGMFRGGNNRGGTFQEEFSGGEYSGHHLVALQITSSHFTGLFPM